MFTTDRNDPELGHGIDESPIPQHKKYLILSEEERAKGFIRPVRQSYVHLGKSGPKNPLRDLIPEEQTRYEKYKYIKYEAYSEEEQKESAAIGRFWTKEDLEKNKGCGVKTTMSLPLAETYARNPKFYGATYCCGCNKHLAVDEFVWDGTNEKVGS